MARLKAESNPKNFEDRTGGNWKDSAADFLYRSMWHYLPGFASQAKKSGKFSPEENDDYVRRNSVPSRARGMTVSDFSPAEWKMVKEQGFSLDDILLIRNRGKK